MILYINDSIFVWERKEVNRVILPVWQAKILSKPIIEIKQVKVPQNFAGVTILFTSWHHAPYLINARFARTLG
jgi:hypothetical protein